MKEIPKFFCLFLLIFLLTYLNYWKNYAEPQMFFWDENYHIASAAKYLKGVFFMEPHPPLGKLLIALGERLFNFNNGNTFGLESFHNIPNTLESSLNSANFSFAGYRFLPTLFACFNVFLFSGIIYFLTRSYILTAALSLLPLLDSSLILHSRGAMLDSFLVFGNLLGLFAFFVLLKSPSQYKKRNLAVGFLMAFGLFFASMTKVFGLALLVLWPLLYYFRRDLRRSFQHAFPLQLLFVLVLSLSTWIVHIQLGKKIEPTLIGKGAYYASAQHEKWILGLEKDSWKNLPLKLYDNLRYIYFYENHVAPLDWNKPVIKGSYPIQWPFASRPIPYRWDERGNFQRFLYLIPNAWAWLMGLAGLLLGISFWIRKGRPFEKENAETISLTVLYFSYLIPMAFISRILYLYHYFPMLIMTWILFALALHKISLWPKWKNKISYVICLIPFLLFSDYYSNRNFINFYSMSCQEIKSKYFPPFWGMNFQNCNFNKKNPNPDPMFGP